jgi:hypothetical protein
MPARGERPPAWLAGYRSARRSRAPGRRLGSAAPAARTASCRGTVGDDGAAGKAATRRGLRELPFAAPRRRVADGTGCPTGVACRVTPNMRIAHEGCRRLNDANAQEPTTIGHCRNPVTTGDLSRPASAYSACWHKYHATILKSSAVPPPAKITQSSWSTSTARPATPAGSAACPPGITRKEGNVGGASESGSGVRPGSGVRSQESGEERLTISG